MSIKFIRSKGPTISRAMCLLTKNVPFENLLIMKYTFLKSRRLKGYILKTQPLDTHNIIQNLKIKKKKWFP